MGLVVALAGGVGAARLLRGLVRVVSCDDLVIVGNTGDDFEFYGLHVCPDLDIVMYTLAGIVDEAKGWGVADDTFSCLGMLEKLGFETWFRLGDGDLAVQIVRTRLLKSGGALSEAVAELCQMLGVKARLVPMSNDPVRTVVLSGRMRLGFQEYFVKRGARDQVSGVLFEGCDDAKPAPGIIEAIDGAERVVICPSNPVLSIDPILSIPAIKDGLKSTRAYVVGVSPIVGGKAVKGPADRIMSSLGLEPSAYGVAKFYEDFLDHIVIDNADACQRTRIERLGTKVTVADTIMRNIENAVSLATKVMDAE
ncbi:MAG: 2-phospho-L-lactate transferase [Candidatus Bathyarchaeia archaeon]